MTTTRMPDVACRSCGTSLSAATGLEDGTRPVAGNLSVCIACGNVAVFTDDGLLRALTFTERLKPEVQVLLRTVDRARCGGAFNRTKD